MQTFFRLSTIPPLKFGLRYSIFGGKGATISHYRYSAMFPFNSYIFGKRARACASVDHADDGFAVWMEEHMDEVLWDTSLETLLNSALVIELVVIYTEADPFVQVVESISITLKNASTFSEKCKVTGQRTNPNFDYEVKWNWSGLPRYAQMEGGVMNEHGIFNASQLKGSKPPAYLPAKKEELVVDHSPRLKRVLRRKKSEPRPRPKQHDESSSDSVRTRVFREFLCAFRARLHE